MISLDINHPDIMEFVDCKTNLERVKYANISVRVNDNFMKAVKEDEDYYLRWPCDKVIIVKAEDFNGSYNELVKVDTGYIKRIKARELFNKLVKNNWDYAEPGILYWDRISNYNLLDTDDEFEYAGTNPCITGDTLVQTIEGEIPIEQLVDSTPYVYCMNEDGNLTIRKATKVWKTRRNATIVEVITGKGKIKCTPDHRIFTTNGGWVEACNLKHGDKIKGHAARNCKNLGKQVGVNWFVEEVVELDYTEDVYDMTVEDTHNFIANGFVVHNCAEEPLPAGGSCLLGSLNLSEFVVYPFTDKAQIAWDKLEEATRIAIRALNQVLMEGMELHPLEEQVNTVKLWRQIGLGTLGLADCLIKLGIKYGSPNSIITISQIYRHIAINAVLESLDMAKAEGCYPACEKKKLIESSFIKNLELPDSVLKEIKQFGLFNSQLLTCAPTGSIGTMLQTSTGVEPNFALHYTRKTQSLEGKDTYYQVDAPIVELYKEIIHSKEENLPSYFVTSADIDPIDRVKVQGELQNWIDASISSTCNLPKEATVDDVYNIYMKAWEEGLKGITIYRSGCKREGVLTLDKPKENTTTTRAPKRPKVLEADFHLVKAKGEQFIVLVGLLNNKPYETFAFKPNITINIPNHKGVIEKRAKMHYNFKSDLIQITELELANNNIEEKAATLYASMLLRHNVDIKYIIKTAKKVNDNIASFTSALCRVLNKYVSPEATGDKCPECGADIIRESGCLHCVACGWSRCE